MGYPKILYLTFTGLLNFWTINDGSLELRPNCVAWSISCATSRHPSSRRNPGQGFLHREVDLNESKKVKGHSLWSLFFNHHLYYHYDYDHHYHYYDYDHHDHHHHHYHQHHHHHHDHHQLEDHILFLNCSVIHFIAPSLIVAILRLFAVSVSVFFLESSGMICWTPCSLFVLNDDFPSIQEQTLCWNHTITFFFELLSESNYEKNLAIQVKDF